MERFEKELKNYFHEIMFAMSEELLIADGNGRVMIVSPSFEEYYGLPKEEAIGKTVYELEASGYFKPSIVAHVLERREKVTAPQKIHGGRQILVTATPIFNDEGAIKLVVSYSRDITEMVHLQKQMEKYTAELEALRKGNVTDQGVVVNSVQMEQIMNVINRIADFDANVLILGPSGTGKSMLAKVIHNKSSRAEGPFVDINCAAIPENLLESELFGYEKGSFTGANATGKMGLIELADKGTLLLDEISEMPLTIQAKLLKAIQDKVITRVGGVEEVKVDFRLIAASNRPLDQYSDEGRFRKDLYYRLNVVNIKIPPLTKRKSDIIPLIDFFTEKFNKQYKLNKSFSPHAMEAMLEYSWPGNVRELSNAIERTMVTSSGDVVKKDELPEEISSKKRYGDKYTLENIKDLNEAAENFERELILQAYEKYGTTVGVAKHLNISQSTAYRKINKYLNC